MKEEGEGPSVVRRGHCRAWAVGSAKRLECGGLPALLDGLGQRESGSKLPHSKRIALSEPLSCLVGFRLRPDPALPNRLTFQLLATA